MFKQIGTTLIELISVLAILGLLMGYVFPSATKIVARSEATSSINRLVGAVNYTRHSAIALKTTATLCPLTYSKRQSIVCGTNWQKKLVVFSDRNSDGKFNGKDTIIDTINSLESRADKQGSMKWRSFRNRRYLQITRFGYTNFQNGNFTYCSADRNSQFSRQIVINVQGRARLVHNKDEIGNQLTYKGKSLRC